MKESKVNVIYIKLQSIMKVYNYNNYITLYYLNLNDFCLGIHLSLYKDYKGIVFDLIFISIQFHTKYHPNNF